MTLSDTQALLERGNLRFQRRHGLAHDLANRVGNADGKGVPSITGVYDVFVELDDVHIRFALNREARDGPMLHFHFRLPLANVARDEVNEFADWLARPGAGTVH